MKLHRILLSLVAAAGIVFAGAAAAHGGGDTVKPNFARTIPGVPSKSLIAVEVMYPPGGASRPHTHAKSAFIYAICRLGQRGQQGQRRAGTRVQGRGKLLRAAGSRHPVSRNASKTEPAKLLAVFVVDSDDKGTDDQRQVGN